MSASTRTALHPWAVAHRTFLLITGLVVLVAAAVLAVSLVLVTRDVPATAPVPAPAVHSTTVGVPADPCEVQQIGRPRPC
jgi:hypothetical protein